MFERVLNLPKKGFNHGENTADKFTNLSKAGASLEFLISHLLQSPSTTVKPWLFGDWLGTCDQFQFEIF